MVNATQAHHIFTQSDYPTIADYVENLIMLTPNQHYSMAHPNNNTQYVDKDFQYICLIAKSTKIYLDLTSEKEDKFYDFDDYKFVLNTGLETEDFTSISYLDFASIIEKIDYYYIDNISNNKYYKLINDNKLDRNQQYLENSIDFKMVAEEQTDYRI
jgi:organic radical activating enzyme